MMVIPQYMPVLFLPEVLACWPVTPPNTYDCQAIMFKLTTHISACTIMDLPLVPSTALIASGFVILGRIVFFKLTSFDSLHRSKLDSAIIIVLL